MDYMDAEYLTADQLGAARETIFIIPRKPKRMSCSLDSSGELSFHIKMMNGTRRHGKMEKTSALEEYTKELIRKSELIGDAVHFIEWNDRINCVVCNSSFAHDTHFFMTKEEFQKFVETIEPAIKGGSIGG